MNIQMSMVAIRGHQGREAAIRRSPGQGGGDVLVTLYVPGDPQTMELRMQNAAEQRLDAARRIAQFLSPDWGEDDVTFIWELLRKFR